MNLLKLFWFLTPLLTLQFADDNGDQGNNDDPPKNPGKDGDGAGGDDKRTFTQTELDALFAARAKSAGSKATADLLKELGVENIEDAKKLLVEADKARKDQMTELEKAQVEIEEAKTAEAEAQKLAEQREALANERLMRAAVIAEASKPDHKFSQDAISDVWSFVDRSKLEVDDEGNVSGVEDAVKAVAKDKPYMLETQPATPGTPPRDKRAPAGTKPPPKTAAEPVGPTIRL